MRNFFVQMMIIFLLFFCCGYKLFVCLAISHLCWMVAVVEFVVCDLKVIQVTYLIYLVGGPRLCLYRFRIDCV